jgi:hypothetical protein
MYLLDIIKYALDIERGTDLESQHVKGINLKII